MKKFFAILLLLQSLVFFSRAQNPIVRISPEYSKKHFAKDFAGYNENNFYTYSVDENRLHLFIFRSKDLVMETEVIKDLPGSVNAKKSILHVINSRPNTALYFITGVQDEENNLFTVFIIECTYQGKFIKTTELEKMSLNKWEKEWKYGYGISPNENYFILYHDFSGNESAKYFVEYKLFSLMDDSIVGDNKIQLTGKYKAFSLQNILIDDSGAIFISLKLRGVYLSQTDNRLLAYNPASEEKISEIKIFNNKFPYSVSFAMDRTNTIICTGLFLDNENLRNINGYFCYRISNKTFKILSKIFTNLPSTLEMVFIDVYESVTYQSIAELELRSIDYTNDSGMIITSEVYHKRFEEHGGPGRTVYFYGDLLIVSLSPQAEIISMDVIPKYQLCYDNCPQLGFIGSGSFGKGTYMYLDNKNNFNGDSKVKINAMDRITTSRVISAIAQTDGTIKYHVVTELNDYKSTGVPEFQNSLCISDDKKQFVYLSKTTHSYRFVKVNFQL